MLNSNNNNTLVSKSIPTLHTVLCTNSNNTTISSGAHHSPTGGQQDTAQPHLPTSWCQT